MKFVELKKSLANRRDACYILSGDDPFVITGALKLFKALVELPEMNEVHLTAPLASDIVAAALVFPMMSPVRLVLVEGFDKDAADLVKYLESPSPETVIVIVSPTLTKNLGVLTDKATVVDCSRQDDNIITAYIARECRNAGISISAPAATLLIESCSGSMTRISVELKKLIAYRSAEGGVIESDDVKRLVTADLEYKVYELGDAVSQRNGDRAMRLINDMLETGDEKAKAHVFGLIYGPFRKLLYVAISDEEEVKNCLGIKDFPYTKLRAQARAYGPKRLKAICDELHALDIGYKTGLISAEMGITTFAMHIVNAGR